MTFRYIGSKARLLRSLREAIGPHPGDGGRFVDAFCGTGAVAELAASEGWPVWVNDSLASAGVMAAARMTAECQAPFAALGGYRAAIDALNGLEPEQGYFWRTYGPASARFDPAGIERRYFTESNAARIDAIRHAIKNWAKANLIGPDEERLLLADLLSAVNRCANIAGTYGCFLAKWQSSAMRRLALEPRELKLGPTSIKATTVDVMGLVVQPEDVVYLDPPYTKRQYASYYHILETIVVGDEPEVAGVSGLRPWQEKASVFCYKRRALNALVSLIRGLAANKVILSYSAEGHVDLSELVDQLADTGAVTCRPVSEIGRYRPNRSASNNGDSVTEYILTYQRSSSPPLLTRKEPLRAPHVMETTSA